MRFSESFCKCHVEKILELEEKIRQLEIKLTVAKTTGERLTRLTKILQGEASRLNR